MFWMTVEKDKLQFKDARGCVDDTNDCIDKNIPKYNIDYVSEFVIDANTMELMRSTSPGMVPNTYNIHTWAKYDTIYALITPKTSIKKVGTIIPIRAIGITLVRDFNRDIIYAFALTFAEDSDWKCKDAWTSLRELGLMVKNNL